jgi:hypothetical protein
MKKAMKMWAGDCRGKSGVAVLPLLITIVVMVVVAVMLLNQSGDDSRPAGAGSVSRAMPRVGRMTKEQWRERARQYDVIHARMDLTRSEFLRIMGKPDRTQTIGEKAYWYYKCRDGMIQVVINTGMMNEVYGDKVIVEVVNDY